MPEIALAFSLSVHSREHAVSSDFIHAFAVLVVAHPNKYRLSNNMVFRYISPFTSIKTVMAIISHHPVVVLLKSVRTGFSTINDGLSSLGF